jgi:hypothetical protein
MTHLSSSNQEGLALLRFGDGCRCFLYSFSHGNFVLRLAYMCLHDVLFVHETVVQKRVLAFFSLS